MEPLLYEADLSPDLVKDLLRAAEREVRSGREAMIGSMVEALTERLRAGSRPETSLPRPCAILLVGVNGSGKTTCAAKLANRYRSEGSEVVLAAADTFRAGAIDQLKEWGRRVDTEVVAQREGADPAAVVHDAWQRAVARGAVLIADTAGRLQNKAPLMEEMKKIVRVLGKDGRGAPHEIFLVLDSTSGQNAGIQAREFSKIVPITGLILAKLDGTARGGAAVASSLDLGLPIRYLGVGEGADDLEPFDPARFSAFFFRG